MRMVFLVLVLAQVLHSDAREFEDFHKLMNPDELQHYFGVSHHQHVKPQSYQVSMVYNTLHIESALSKRSGEDPPDAAYKVSVFGNTYNLKMKRNNRLLARNMTYREIEGPRTKDIQINNAKRLSLADDTDSWGFSECDHYLGIGAALSSCGAEGVRGLIFDNQTYEVYPMTKRMMELFSATNRTGLTREPRGLPHLIKMADKIPEMEDLAVGSFKTKNKRTGKNRRNKKQLRAGRLYIETALFPDAAAYQFYSKFYSGSGFSNPDIKIRDLVLSWMNSIQALYHFSSLGTVVDFSIVRLEIHKTQPADFPSYDGERGQLLTSFCNYQGKNNPAGDSNPQHWDIGLLVSGLDFWSMEGGKKSYLTMGLATVTGICTNSYGCVIGELGVRSPEGKPYPSTGFTSVYVMAHEIGHNLGMSHDSSGNSCDANGYIMSPSRGTVGETAWSQCSRDLISSLNLDCLTDQPAAMVSELDHNKFNNNPGQTIDADTQCKILLFDNDASMDNNGDNIQDICSSLKCRSPHKIGYYRSGPALEGTPCGNNVICQQGGCVKNTISPGVVSISSWSDWSFSECKSGCLTRSKGFVTKTRTCIKQTPVSSASSCPGNSQEVTLCDNPDCKGYDVPTNFANKQCFNFQKASSRLDKMIKNIGTQPPYDKDRVDMACTISCRQVKGGWYAPVLELNDISTLSAYFPDGTWCHNDGDSDFYCRNHQCVSSSRGARADRVPDLGVSSNALPGGQYSIPKEVMNYFTLNEDKVALSNNPRPQDNNEAKEDDWEVMDYITI